MASAELSPCSQTPHNEKVAGNPLLFSCNGSMMRAFGDSPSAAIMQVVLTRQEVGWEKGKLMDELEAGKKDFLELVRGVDSAVQVVIPVTPSNSMFLISLTKGPNRKFITIPEDDIIDLPNEADIRAKVTKVVRDAIGSL